MSNSISTLIRLVVIIVVMIIAVVLILGVAGVLSSDELRNSIVKIAQVAAIILVASGAILFAAKK